MLITLNNNKNTENAGMNIVKKSTTSCDQYIDGHNPSKPKKLPYQKPELVEINLSDDSQGKVFSFYEDTTGGIYVYVGPS